MAWTKDAVAPAAAVRRRGIVTSGRTETTTLRGTMLCHEAILLHRDPRVSLTPRVALLLTVPPLMWGGNAVIGSMLADRVPPLQLNFMRWAVALAVLLPLAWRAIASAERRAEIRTRWPALLVLGGLGVGAYNSLQYLALQTSTPINVALIGAITPVFAMLIGIVLFGERPRPRQWLGAGVSALGVVVVLVHGDVAQLSAVRFVAGDLWMLLAALFWAGYSWALARPAPSMRGERRPNWNWAEFLFAQVLFGMMWSGLTAGAEVLVVDRAVRWSGGVVLALLFLGVGPSVLAYRCWGAGVAAVGPAKATFFGNLTPVFAALLSSALLGQAPQWHHGVAFALIVTGITIANRA